MRTSNGMDALYQKCRQKAKCYSISVKKRYSSPSPQKLSRMKGVIDITRSGKGFLLNPEGDILVPREKLGGALAGDIVEISVLRRGRFTSGSVVGILERKRNSFVGELVRTPLGIVLRRFSRCPCRKQSNPRCGGLGGTAAERKGSVCFRSGGSA